MAIITPFRGLRPKRDLAARVATLPYDVMNTEEARAYASDPYHFYHVTRSEINMPADQDPHSPKVYELARTNLERMIEEGVLIRDDLPCYYVYEITMHGRAQTGLIAGSSVKDYAQGVIRKHELTRPEKEMDRIHHIQATRAQTGVVFLAYPDQSELTRWMADAKENEPEYDFVSDDQIRHRLWVVKDKEKNDTATRLFAEQVPYTYIADGHHRAASAYKVYEMERATSLSADPQLDSAYFITCLFPASELLIMDYNRVAKDLNGRSPDEFLRELETDFQVQASADNQAVRPAQPHEFGMYMDGKWYRLVTRAGHYPDDLIGELDVSILQEKVLSNFLHIHDPRTDNRVDFVGGIRGLEELERRVDSGEMAVAFSCYPVRIEQLFRIADAGMVMPPKSTWFEPKLRDGLVVYPLF